MNEQLEKFGVFLLVNKGLQPYTINGYQSGVKRFLRKTSTLKPTADQVINCVAQMRRQGNSYSHVVNTSLALERYLEFLGTPFRLGRPRKPQRTVPATLSEAEIARIIGAAKNIREKAILVVLAYSGVRAREFCDLKVQDLDLANLNLRVRNGKGNKERVVCVPPECAQVINEYLKAHPKKPADCLFTSLKRDGYYTPWNLRKLVKTLAKRADVNRRVYPHIFRHSLATNMINRGASLFTIQQQLGHAYVETTMIYLHPALRRIRNEYLLYVPNYV